MTSKRRPLALLTFLFSFVSFGLLAPGSARAQAPTDRTIDAQLFQPAIGPRNFLTVDGAEVPEHKRLSFGLTLNYQRRPYTTFTQGTTEGAAHVVDDQWTGELQGAIGLFDRFQLGLAVPYTLYLTGDDIDAMGVGTGGRLHENGLGDIRVEAKGQIATLGDDDEYSFAALAGLSLPTNKAVDRPYYLGDKNVTGRIKGIAMLQLGHVRAAANLGLLL